MHAIVHSPRPQKHQQSNFNSLMADANAIPIYADRHADVPFSFSDD